MNKELSHSDTTMIQEVITTNYQILKNLLIKNNSKDLLNIEEGCVTVLDGGNEFILANWPNDKHIICTINNDIPIRIPSHPYVLENRSVLYNCSMEAENC